MAILHSYDLSGQKDSFSEWISNISPTDTFIVTNSKKESTPTTHFKWQTDNLDPFGYDLDLTHVQEVIEEGDKQPDVTLIPTKDKMGITQIFRKTFSISDSALATSNHGRQGELKLQLEKAGKELKNVMEVVFSSKQVQRPASAAPQGGRTDGLFAQIAPLNALNTDLPAASQAGTAVHIATAVGAGVNFADIEKVAKALYLSGSQACCILLNPTRAVEMALATEEAGQSIRQLQTFDVGITDEYPGHILDKEMLTITDLRGKQWGICFSRYVPTDLVYFLHPEDLVQRVLREPKAVQLGKNGAYETWQLSIEAGLALGNPFAAGVIEVK